MNINKEISLRKYVDSARQELNSTKSKLENIERDFKERMNGESIRKLIGAMLCTIVWIAVFNVMYWIFDNNVEAKSFITSTTEEIFLSLCFGIAILLLVVMFIDELMLFFHYEKFSTYSDMITQLNRRVISAQTSLSTESTKLLNSKSNGWNVPIPLTRPISEESLIIKRCVNSIDSLKKGAIERIKNILFFSLVVIFTGFSLWLLLEPSIQILYDAFDGDVTEKTFRILCIIGMIIVLIGELFLSILVWNSSDCSVKNITLLILLAGPVLFVLWAIVICLLILIVKLLGTIIIGLLQVVGYIAIAALVLCCCCGG